MRLGRNEMTDGMIQRLAEKWSAETGEHYDEPILRSDARWWLRAIADELVTNLDSPMGTTDVAVWLNGEANADESREAR
jgi:hypothetical protein